MEYGIPGRTSIPTHSNTDRRAANAMVGISEADTGGSRGIIRSWGCGVAKERC